MNISLRGLIIIGAAVFVSGVVVLFPARVAYSVLAPDAVRLSGLSGTVWNGSAAEGEIAGLYLRDFRWRLHPFQLLLGRLGVDVQVSPAGGFLETAASLSPGGTVTLTDLEAGIAIEALQGVLPTPGIEGNVRLLFSTLEIRDGFPSAADGVVEVFALVARGLSPAPIGDFRAELTTGEDAITGSIEDIGGVLDVAGSLRLGTDRSYALNGLVAPTPQASPAIVDQLQFLGPANERGQRPFRLEGQL